MKLSTAVLALVVLPGAWGETNQCSKIATLYNPGTRVVSAEEVPTGTFRLPGDSSSDPEQTELFRNLPSFCRAVLELAPAPDSNIKVEVWLPAKKWNGKFRGQGNGGFAGQIDYHGLANAVSQGYASAATDTGHRGESTDANWALGHPEWVTDFGYRAVHEMTVEGQKLVAQFYGRAPSRSYFASCSDGGREALMEAQRFPHDYDGIVAGAPAYNWSRLLVNAVHKSQALLLDPASYISPVKLPAISSAVLRTCDAGDGLRDGVVNDPSRCQFDPAVLLCKGPDTNACLTAPQVASLRALYAGARDTKGNLVYPGYLPGAELGSGGWQVWITGPVPQTSLMYLFGTHYFADMVYRNSAWDYKTFSVDQGLADALQQTSRDLDATDPDLRRFAKRGGKLILYHGWNDPAISAYGTIEYFRQIRGTLGNRATDSFARLFMVPGMQHCMGGPGADSFGQFGPLTASGADDPEHDILLAMEQWVESGRAPDRLIAAHFTGVGSARTVTMARPLCAWPRVARYNGTGDPNAAASFGCAEKK